MCSMWGRMYWCTVIFLVLEAGTFEVCIAVDIQASSTTSHCWVLCRNSTVSLHWSDSAMHWWEQWHMTSVNSALKYDGNIWWFSKLRMTQGWINCGSLHLKLFIHLPFILTLKAWYKALILPHAGKTNTSWCWKKLIFLEDFWSSGCIHI